MYVSVAGKNKHVSQAHIEEGIKYLGVKLLGSRMAKNVGIEIKLTPNLRHTKDAYGLFYISDENIRNPREFDIELDSRLGKQDLLMAISHEMVHIKQAVRKELVDVDIYREEGYPRRVMWQGTLYEEDEIDYWDRPWEIEAHGRERGLYLYMMEHFDSIGI